MNIKIGLLNRLDAQLLIEPYNIVYEKEGDYYQATWRGNGDTTIRFKYNLWGNDGGRTAPAPPPDVKMPTHPRGPRKTSTQGGIGPPFWVGMSRELHAGVSARDRP